MLCCFVQIVGMGNSYNQDYPFKYWDLDVNSIEFLSALVCCILQMFCDIVNQKCL